MRIRLLFLGASRLVGLLERFIAAGRAEAVEVENFSIEDDSPWHAIGAAGVAHIIPGPRFLSGELAPFLLERVRELGINIVVPSVDAATVALAQLRGQLAQMGVAATVSDESLCRAMHDKRLADCWFRENHLPVPAASDGIWPQLAKPRFGASSRDITVFSNGEDFRAWAEKHTVDDYVVQRFISGVEYSIDAYAGKNGFAEAVSRVRVVTSGGEAMVTRTERNPRVLDVVNHALACPGWYGPLVFQVIDDGTNAWLIECNPRFGSGATCSIEAGLDMPRWILREYLGRPLPKGPIEWRAGLCMTRSRKDWFVWLSS